MSDTFDPYYKWLGIAPSEQPPHHYRLLGVRAFEPDREVISSAADRQMAHIRTFQTGARSAESQNLLNEIAAASLCLLKPDKKAAYDAELRARLAPQQPRPVARPPVPAATPLPAVVRPAVLPTNVSPAATAPVRAEAALGIDLSAERSASRRRTEATATSVLPFAIAGVLVLSLAIVGVWALQGSGPTKKVVRGPEKKPATAASKLESPRTQAPQEPTKLAKVGDLPQQFTPAPPVEALVPRDFSVGSKAPAPPPLVRHKEAPIASPNVRIIDNGDPHYVEIGEWRAGRGVGFRNGYRAADAVSGRNRAEWTFDGLQSGRRYRLHVTWAAGTNRSQQAKYRIIGATSATAEKVVNQRFEPVDLTTGSIVWCDLGEHIPRDSSLTIELSGPDENPIIADAVRLEDLEAEPPATVTP